MREEAAIRQCLRQKHSKDLIVEECKDGPTMTGSHLRMDMWVMPRSWSKPATTAYEIKVARSDFLRDEKWTGYLNLCHKLYFACPTGLIEPDELPEGIGLMWLSKTGNRLYTKRKAAERDITIPENLWRYILMCRASIEPERRFTNGDREYWERWLEEKRVDKEFGYHVGREIQRRVEEEVLRANARSERAETALKEYEALRRKIAEIIGRDFDVHNPPPVFSVEQELQELQEVIPPKLRREIRNLSDRLSRLVDGVENQEARREALKETEEA